MTYKYYIFKNHLPDSVESYRSYCERYISFWSAMGDGMKEQFIATNYKFRFA